MLATLRRLGPLAIAGIVAGLLALGFAGTALADTVTGTLGVTGGAFAIAASDAPGLALTLDGTNQTISDTFTLDAKDLRGSGAGWKVTITSTTFANEGGKTLANNAATITGLAVACDGGTCTSPVNAVTYPLTVPADSTAPTAATLFNAAVDTGMGDFTLTPTFQLSVPANAYAGNYSSTITIDLATGPS